MYNIKVLLVEDEKHVRDSIKAMLHEMGIQDVKEASDGQEALRYIDERPEDVSFIVCDWNMPNKSGLGLLKDIRQAFPDLPFLMITARADEDSVKAARDSHVTGYICKPFSFNDFRNKIDRIINSVEFQ